MFCLLSLIGDGDSSYMDDQQQQRQHHLQASSQRQPGPRGGEGGGDDIRPSHVFHTYGSYSSDAQPHPSSSTSMSIHGALSGGGVPGQPIVARSQGGSDGTSTGNRRRRGAPDDPEDQFPELPESKRRKFILIEDNDRRSRLRVRVTLDTVDTREIPDSFRKGASVYPRSYFAREMQSPPPSAMGSRFFTDDLDEGGGDDDAVETEGRRVGKGKGAARRSRSSPGREKVMVRVPVNGGSEAEVAIPRMRKAARGKEVRLNDLGYRIAWLQSRVFSGRTIFLQRACK